MTKLVVITLTLSFALACGSGTDTANSAISNSKPVQPSAVSTPANSPARMPQIPKDGTYKGHGLVTRVSNDLGSIEIEHDDIPNMMPAMKMEFYVKDKSMLNGIYANDEVNFVIEYKHPEEKIISLTKVKKTKKDED